MRQRGTIVGKRVGIGQFAGTVDPHDPTKAAVHQTLCSLMGDPGIRLAEGMAARASRRWTGTALAPQSYVRMAGGTNSSEALGATEHAPPKLNRSRALGQFRGLPAMGTPDPWPNPS
jgi:hypothetical protein